MWTSRMSTSGPSCGSGHHRHLLQEHLHPGAAGCQHRAAIAINMGIPYFTGTELPFIASIVIGTIQLGATVDYSILMTTRYHEERVFGRTPKEAAQQSLEHCSQSILTSGLTFFAATVGVAAISKMELLKSICLLISRGALISMIVILSFCPPP